jgi:protein-S-isoprenylcysteine O-methyltransferase Ste14
LRSFFEVWCDVVFGRVVPVLVFGLLLSVKVSGLVQLLQVGVGDGRPLTFFAHVVQQGTSVMFLGFLVLLFSVRRTVIGPRSSIGGVLVALAGTFSVAIPVGARVVEDNPTTLFLSSALIMAGTLWSVASLAFLGRCFGILPEARGLVTRGPYRWVRHPLYLGEIISVLGLVVATLSAPLLAVFLVGCGLQYWRALNEERALTEVFPEYADYRRRTYRLIPGVH